MHRHLLPSQTGKLLGTPRWHRLTHDEHCAQAPVVSFINAICGDFFFVSKFSVERFFIFLTNGLQLLHDFVVV